MSIDQEENIDDLDDDHDHDHGNDNDNHGQSKSNHPVLNLCPNQIPEKEKRNYEIPFLMRIFYSTSQPVGEFEWF
ncbi:hypothetical protein SCA6_011963 [Theobroma cacao]